MILVVNVCAEKLHYLEFVKPVEAVLSNHGFFTKHYSGIAEKDLAKAEKIIICGTSLKDNKFIGDIGKFEWIKDANKPILGICAGMQIIGLVFKGVLKRKTEIGFYKENFKEFLGLKGKENVYHLHNHYADFSKDFEIFSKDKIPQAVRYKRIYGVLFHPEVRQKSLILNFARYG